MKEESGEGAEVEDKRKRVRGMEQRGEEAKGKEERLEDRG
jgi:hypothetical protein